MAVIDQVVSADPSTLWIYDGNGRENRDPLDETMLLCTNAMDDMMSHGSG